MILFRFFLSLIPVYFVGWLVLSFFLDQTSHFTRGERNALSWGLGWGFLTLEMFYFALLKLPWNPFLLLLPWCLLFPFALGRRKIVSPASISLNPFERSLLLFFLFLFLYVSIDALTFPLTYYEFWDTWSIWGHKAKAFALKRSVDFSFFTDPSRYFTHQDYPLLLPLSEGWIYLGLGKIDEITVKLLFSLFFLSFLVLFWGACRREKNRKDSLLLTGFLATLPIFLQYVVQGYAELPLTFYYTFSTLYLYFWCQTGRREDLWMGIFLSLFAAWTKNEGLALFVLNASLFGIGHFVSFPGSPRRKLSEGLLLFSPVFFLLPWWLFLRWAGLSSEFFPQLRAGTFLALFWRLPVILMAFFWKILDLTKWNFLWIGFLLFGIIYWRDLFSFSKRILVLALFLHFFLYIVIYVIHPLDVLWVMDVDDSFNRILLHAAPVSLFLLGSLLRWENGTS